MAVVDERYILGAEEVHYAVSITWDIQLLLPLIACLHQVVRLVEIFFFPDAFFCFWKAILAVGIVDRVRLAYSRGVEGENTLDAELTPSVDLTALIKQTGDSSS